MIYKKICGALDNNVYFIVNNGEAVMIDASLDMDAVYRTLDNCNAVLKACLLTHGHFDHIGACRKLNEANIPVYAHKSEVNRLKTPDVSRIFGITAPDGARVDKYVKDGDILQLIGLNIKVIHTPGHTEGSVCYAVGNALFTGDTLFKDSFGRTDLSGGDTRAIKESIVDKLFALEGDYTVYCGHGDDSTLQYERENNFIRSVR